MTTDDTPGGTGDRDPAREPPPRPARGLQRVARPLPGLLDWVRAQPLLAAAVLVFCLVAVGGLLLTLPRGTFVSAPSQRQARSVAAQPDTPPAPAPSEPAPEAPAPGPWVTQSTSVASARGLGMDYAYRTLPPGSESRFEWMVRLAGAQPLLDGIEVVTWRMDPPAKNGESFVSRDRAADGFPLFGHGPGGWFGVAAAVRYKDGEEETLTGRIEFPD